MNTPLADALRPKSLDEVVGQRHLLGEGMVLRRLIESGHIPNLIFYGPSGVGKTTVARIIAASTGKLLRRLNGTTCGTADLKEVFDQRDTLDGRSGILLYLDEIQYLNKKQQQTLLESIEDGSVTLIASTTENPYFYVYGAILSRCTVFEFRAVEPAEVTRAVVRAFSKAEELFDSRYSLEDGVAEYIASACGGDVRKALNAVEALCAASGEQKVTLDAARQVSQRSAMRYDRDGDAHYDILLEAGDLLSACRRLLVCAAEDVGLAWPQILPVVKAAVDSALQLGLPEARIPLADAVILVATAPKSNTGICAIDAALEDVREGRGGEIPDHLRDGHYGGAQKLGHASGYRYPHDFGGWVAQQYLPDPLREARYYRFGENKTEQAALEFRRRQRAGRD